MKPIVNIAGYRFVELTDLKDRRSELRKQCIALGIKGTILLSAEGINLVLNQESTAEAENDETRHPGNGA